MYLFFVVATRTKKSAASHKYEKIMEKNHQFIKQGMQVCCLAFSNRRDFTQLTALSDAWLPNGNKWVGEYPFLLRPAFEELCYLRING